MVILEPNATVINNIRQKGQFCLFLMMNNFGFIPFPDLKLKFKILFLVFSKVEFQPEIAKFQYHSYLTIDI